MNFCPNCGKAISSALFTIQCSDCLFRFRFPVWRWNEQLDQALRGAFKTTPAITIALGWKVPYAGIRKRLAVLGITNRCGSKKGKLKPRAHQPIFDETDKANYEGGQTLKEIAAKRNCSITKAWRWLQSVGVAIRPRGSRFQKDYPAILERFDAGETLGSIGAAFGISRERVRQIAVEAGRPPRDHRNPLLVARAKQRGEQKIAIKTKRAQEGKQQELARLESIAKLDAEGKTHKEMAELGFKSSASKICKLRKKFPERFPRRLRYRRLSINYLYRRLLCFLRWRKKQLLLFQQNEEMMRAATVWAECQNYEAAANRLGLRKNVFRGRLNRWRKRAPQLFPKKWLLAKGGKRPDQLHTQSPLRPSPASAA